MCLLEQFNQWDVVITLSILTGMLAAFIKPIITLVKTLTRLVTVVGALEKHCAKTEDINITEHKEFRDKFEEQGDTLAEHGNMLQEHDKVIKDALINHT